MTSIDWRPRRKSASWRGGWLELWGWEALAELVSGLLDLLLGSLL